MYKSMKRHANTFSDVTVRLSTVPPDSRRGIKTRQDMPRNQQDASDALAYMLSWVVFNTLKMGQCLKSTTIPEEQFASSKDLRR